MSHQLTHILQQNEHSFKENPVSKLTGHGHIYYILYQIKETMLLFGLPGIWLVMDLIWERPGMGWWRLISFRGNWVKQDGCGPALRPSLAPAIRKCLVF
jgi:hypothetical protein